MHVVVDGDVSAARSAFEQAGMEVRREREVLVDVDDTPGGLGRSTDQRRAPLVGSTMTTSEAEPRTHTPESAATMPPAPARVAADCVAGMLGLASSISCSLGR